MKEIKHRHRGGRGGPGFGKPLSRELTATIKWHLTKVPCPMMWDGGTELTPASPLAFKRQIASGLQRQSHFWDHTACLVDTSCRLHNYKESLVVSLDKDVVQMHSAQEMNAEKYIPI